MPWALIVAACLGGFAATSSGNTRAPFLVSMAVDLNTSESMIANLIALTALAWGVTSFIGGVGSDRWGRKPFLVGGPIALAIAMVLVAGAGSYLEVAIWATLGGACCGTFVGACFAEVAEWTAPSHRGRALAWVMTGQSLTLVAAVPLASWIGAGIGWRGVSISVAVLAAIAALALALTARGQNSAGGTTMPGQPILSRQAFTPLVRKLLTMVVAERICFGLAAIYFASLLQKAYGASLEAIVLPLVVFALGNVLGTTLGGPLADRGSNRLLGFAAAMIVSAALAVALFGWLPGMLPTVLLGFAYMAVNGLGRPCLMAALADVPSAVRGTVMGLNGTSASLGWVGAGWFGALALEAGGLPVLGPLIAVLALLAGGLALWRT